MAKQSNIIEYYHPERFGVVPLVFVDHSAPILKSTGRVQFNNLLRILCYARLYREKWAVKFQKELTRVIRSGHYFSANTVYEIEHCNRALTGVDEKTIRVWFCSAEDRWEIYAQFAIANISH